MITTTIPIIKTSHTNDKTSNAVFVGIRTRGTPTFRTPNAIRPRPVGKKISNCAITILSVVAQQRSRVPAKRWLANSAVSAITNAIAPIIINNTE